MAHDQRVSITLWCGVAEPWRRESFSLLGMTGAIRREERGWGLGAGETKWK
jgi:hypothetical protein